MRTIGPPDGGSWSELDRVLYFYCTNKSPSPFHAPNDDGSTRFSFVELAQARVTSEELYLWSAPIDIAERYQFYLNQLSTTHRPVGDQETDYFYNCSLPRFGSTCEYELTDYDPEYTSVREIINNRHERQADESSNMTCYLHLQCNRGSARACLDWSEICDGNFDCLETQVDEEHCWQLTANKCQDDEFQCYNGQCIPQAFVGTDGYIHDCLDMTDSGSLLEVDRKYLVRDEFRRHDSQCPLKSFSSSCLADRHDLLAESMFSAVDDSLSEECRVAMQCFLGVPRLKESICDELCSNGTCVEEAERACPDMFYMPSVPVLFGYMYSAFRRDELQMLSERNIWSYYLCLKTPDSDDHWSAYVQVSFNNATCYRYVQERDLFEDYDDPRLWKNSFLEVARWQFWHHRQAYNHTFSICQQPNSYHCVNASKCILTSRLNDGLPDCPAGDDEEGTYANDTGAAQQIEEDNEKRHNTTFLTREFTEDNLQFQTLCNGYTEFSPITTDEHIDTDETDCERWACDNWYTRCNNIWNCPNGADEIGCLTKPPIACSSREHLCISFDTNQFICLPIEKANDGTIDCLGATDEPRECQYRVGDEIHHEFRCRNGSRRKCIERRELCNNENDCDGGDDEKPCIVEISHIFFNDCADLTSRSLTPRQFIVCKYARSSQDPFTTYFSPLSIDSAQISWLNQLISQLLNLVSTGRISSSTDQSLCHYGLALRVRSNDTDQNFTTTACLCPPNYYGEYCQYQNQRVVPSIKFRTMFGSWYTLFLVVVYLIDDSPNRTVHSYERFTYLPVRDCQVEFSLFLLYATRPKRTTNRYAIQIDIYEKASLHYRGSLFYPILFPFLPVHRLAFEVSIPKRNHIIRPCSQRPCIHGLCIHYLNKAVDDGFCRCDPGWSGQDCSIPHACQCSQDSLCVGVSADNRSICVCPIHKFGSRCLLTNNICHNDANPVCQNGGVCVPNDEDRHIEPNFTCMCRDGFVGVRCETAVKTLVFTFDRAIAKPSMMLVHFIETLSKHRPDRKTSFVPLPNKQSSSVTHWLHPFHLAFVELDRHNYYLAVSPRPYDEHSIISETIDPSDRCPHVRNLLNQTVAKLHLLRRVKFYHLICQEHPSNPSCFYDEVQLCICYDFHRQRLADCFNFNHSTVYDCHGQSECENGAHCIQDHPTCPRRTMCACPSCFFGARCQLSSSGFGLSLDAILGHHILAHVPLRDQPVIVLLTMTLSVVFLVTGILNGIFALITFQNEAVREVGCGIYLLGSSITTLLTMIAFGLKCWILLLTHMLVISNRSFMQIQCVSLDFLLRTSIIMDQWLNACVAAERAVTAAKKTHFDKKKSKRMAKVAISILLVFVIGTCIHDPIHRRLVDEGSEVDMETGKRTWCVVTFSHQVGRFDYVSHVLHFFGPFIINIVSIVILTMKKFHREMNVRSSDNQLQLFWKQFRQHQHLFVASIVLVTLGIPRLVLLFMSKCMQADSNTWLYLSGYLISLVPPMITSIIFILPSKFYKAELRKTIRRYRANTRRFLSLTR